MTTTHWTWFSRRPDVPMDAAVEVVLARDLSSFRACAAAVKLGAKADACMSTRPTFRRRDSNSRSCDLIINVRSESQMPNVASVVRGSAAVRLAGHYVGTPGRALGSADYAQPPTVYLLKVVSGKATGQGAGGKATLELRVEVVKAAVPPVWRWASWEHSVSDRVYDMLEALGLA